MAYTESLDRSKAIKTIFIRPGHNNVADEMIYGSVDLDILPGMCVDLVAKTKYSSGHATNKGGYYSPQITNFNYYEGQTVDDEWAVDTPIMTRIVKVGDIVAVRVAEGTVANYAKGVKLINMAAVDAADSLGFSFESGTPVINTVCHFQVEVPPAADVAASGSVLIKARCIPVEYITNPTA